ncbi:host specificity protein J [Photobacterium sp. 1_MG-2023]|uniref:host specificity protein J n=1 Tax=Photobacterium sp. 1_MG-2023 TaxID=3062646 RepID=UPI0026E35F77|nr:phage tail protein [Photobacterium sp. 1_MG-2023]MDO6707914.1 phage tail protein [Photobacterium sp. 1_MG-2023]
MSKGAGEQHTPVEQPDNLKSRQQLAVIDLIGEGEIEGPIGGLKSVFLDDTPIQNPGGSFNFSGVSAKWTNGTQAQAALSGFSYLENEQPVSLEVKAEMPLVRSVTNPNIDRLRITFGVQSLFQMEDNGDINGTSVQLSVELSKNGTWQPAQFETITGKTRSQYLKSLELSNLPPVPFNIRVSRVTPDSDNSKLNNKTVWSSYTEITDSKLRYPNTAYVGLILDSDQFSGVPRRSYLVRGRRVQVPRNYDPETRQYNGLWDGTFKIAWTDNPAWVFYDLVTCARAGLGRRLGPDGADKWALYQVGQYCDQLVPDGKGGQEPRFTANFALTDPQQAYEVINQLASMFRGMPIWDGLQMSVIPDIPTDPVCRYGNANVVDGKFTYRGSPLKGRHTAVYVRWQDPNNGWEESTEYVSDDDALARYGWNPANINAFGCTSKGQARRAGQWLLITEQHERRTVTFKTGREGLRHKGGEIIEVADNQYAGTNISGRVIAIDGKRVTLDRDIVIEPGQNGWLGYADIEGKEWTVSIFSHPEPHIVVLDDMPTGLEDYRMWTLATGTVKPTLWRCVSVSEDKGVYTVTALEHVPEKHALIENGIKFDPPEDTIYSGKIPAVEHLQVEATPEDSQYQIRLTWDTPRTMNGLRFQVKLMRDGLVQKRQSVDDTEFFVGSLPMGDYTAYVRGVNSQGQVGPQTMVVFNIAPPAIPVDIDFEPDNFAITARPVIDGPTSLGTQYEWYFGLTQQEVSNRLNPLGRGERLNKQALKPDTQYWFGVEAVNSVGRSGLFSKPVKTLLKPDDILQIIRPEIPKLDWAKELNQMVEDNSAAVVLLGNRAALVVNQDGRVSGMTVTASSQASAIDFMADYVSFTDPETKKRNLYWDNALKTLVLKGKIQLLDGHTVSSIDDIRALDGQDGNTIYTEFQFSVDGLNWHFPDQPGDIYLRSRVVTNGSPGNWGAVTNLKGDKGDKGDNATERYTWVKYADSATGSGLSDSPAGKRYMGVAYNRTTAAESNIATDYSWSLIQGEKGDAGSTVYTEFQFSSDKSSWHFPEQAGDIYLRSREVTNGSPGNWGAVTNLKGDKGDKGDNATERYTWVKYADSATGSGLSDSPAGKRYMGVAYNRTTAAESTIATDYSWSLIQGEKGDAGSTVYTEFQFSSDKSSWHFPEQAGDIYLRSREVTNGSPGNWGAVTNLKGDKGDKGQDGQNGQDGQDATERFTWFKYADGPDGSGMSDTGTGKAYIGIAYNQTTATESTNPADYTWSKIKGEDGQHGSPGAGVFRMQTETGVFPTGTETANSLFTSHVGRPPVMDDVLSVYAIDEMGYMTQADSRMYDGESWVTPKLFIDGDLVALGTIRGEHIVAGVELRVPVIKGGEAYFGEGGGFAGYHTHITDDGTVYTEKLDASGVIRSSLIEGSDIRGSVITGGVIYGADISTTTNYGIQANPWFPGSIPSSLYYYRSFNRDILVKGQDKVSKRVTRRYDPRVGQTTATFRIPITNAFDNKDWGSASYTTQDRACYPKIPANAFRFRTTTPATRSGSGESCRFTIRVRDRVGNAVLQQTSVMRDVNHNNASWSMTLNGIRFNWSSSQSGKVISISMNSSAGTWGSFNESARGVFEIELYWPDAPYGPIEQYFECSLDNTKPIA